VIALRFGSMEWEDAAAAFAVAVVIVAKAISVEVVDYAIVVGIMMGVVGAYVAAEDVRAVNAVAVGGGGGLGRVLGHCVRASVCVCT